jgi:hypothetical protein
VGGSDEPLCHHRRRGDQQAKQQADEPTHNERQAVKRGIVKSISHGSVGRFLKRRRPQAASSRYWLTPKPDPEFDTKCADICAVYQAAPGAAEQGVRTVSIDEMTGIQALERAAARATRSVVVLSTDRAHHHPVSAV